MFGAVLLRAPCVIRAEEFRVVTDALGLAGGEYPYFTDNYRAAIAPGVVNASSTRPSYPVPPHTEQAFSRLRPGIVAFVCLEPARAGGETPLHDCVAVYASLEPDVRSLLDRSWFCKETRRMTPEALRSNFNTEERCEIERICDRFHVPYLWEAGSLSITTKGPCVVVHPRTGERAFSCFWTAASVYHFFRTFANAPGASRCAGWIARSLPVQAVAGALRRFHPFFRRDYVYSFERDGARASLSPEVELRLNEAVWAHTTIFHWRRGDILLIDNVKVAHSRMPFVPPRQVGTAVFQYYDSIAAKAPVSVPAA